MFTWQKKSEFQKKNVKLPVDEASNVTCLHNSVITKII